MRRAGRGSAARRFARPPPRSRRRSSSSALAMLAGLGDAALASGALKRLTFGHSVQGTKLRAVRLGDPDATRKALVIGSIHGDESEGHEIVRRLRRSHRDTPGVQLWVVTSVNPDGVQAGTRKNARGVDLNRNFSYRWRGGVPPSSGYYPGPHPFSEPESRAVRRLARRLKPRVTIWYHQPWGQVLLPCHGPRPQAEAIRAHRAPARQTLSRTADCVAPRRAGRTTVSRAPRSWSSCPAASCRTRRPGATPARRRRWREAGPGGGSCDPAAPPASRPPAGRRSAARARLRRPPIDRDPIPYGHERKRQMAGVLGAPLRAAQVAPPPSPGDRPALHRRAQLQVGVGDVRLQRPQPG